MLHLVAAPVFEHHKAIPVARRFLKTGIRHDDAQLAFLVRSNEDVADLRTIVADTFDKKDPLAFLDLTKCTRRNL